MTTPPTAAAPVPRVPFSDFAGAPNPAPAPALAAITAAWRLPEPQALPPLLADARLPPALAQATQDLAHRLAGALRHRRAAGGRAGIVQGLLQEFSLSSQEGVALMCLAEALLRIPDSATRDALIRDKIAQGHWQAHLGKSPSLFVNAATWGLLLTGKLVATHSEGGLSALLARLIARGGEPLIRKSVDMAMRLMGEQFVTGETIAEALRHAAPLEARGFRYSYDMLGEAALTAADAERYLDAYADAIRAIGQAAAGRGVLQGPGISIKLSALHPRYSRAQQGRVMRQLYPRLRRLALLARQHDIGLNIDAEEADRLMPSLALLARLCDEPALAGWQGIGFVVQAYQKRCPAVIDHLIALARRSGHRLMVRLVKGAYWDSEIKRAQEGGLDGYPVYTRKAHTDVAYLACARRLLAAGDAVYPQFATHNAQTLAAIYHLADPARWAPGQYEFQCLHGMGEPLYEQVVGPASEGRLDRPCRIYAPVGTHETLLAYLVRRLLENGANTSFVNRIADPHLDLRTLVQDPVRSALQMAAADGTMGLPHPAIPLPRDLYGATRPNSRGLDLADDATLGELAQALRASAAQAWLAAPMLDSDVVGCAPWQPVRNPADARDTVGQVQDASSAEVDLALHLAVQAVPSWAATSPASRAAMLDDAADQLEAQRLHLMGLLIREAGKTAGNALAEVREAVDFLRFYAAQVRHGFDNATHRPLGPVVCISPWNFPLAIFTGQVAAALAAGNTVLAKPAEQTPLIAAEAVRALWRAGVPRGALQLLPGPGETVGAALVAGECVRGVLFTGSTAVARRLQDSLAGRLDDHGQPLPLVAETGGQNAMIVDSSALPEQVVADVLASAFDSAGQRCSALRVLCLQDDVADNVLTMLRGAMAELCVGNPDRLAVDVGPVIDAEALRRLQQHVAAMRARGCRVHQPSRDADADADADAEADADALSHGTFLPPTLIEIDDLAQLREEVFGPVLHVLRWRRAGLDALLAQVNATGYGLTLGLHTRIDETIDRVLSLAHAGNVYVNRNMVGAVVGVQPFGGEGLSGTGPKAGGPLYLYRLLSQRPGDAPARALAAAGADAAVSLLAQTGKATEAGNALPALQAFASWAEGSGRTALAAACRRFAGRASQALQQACVLRGPTGERNVYRLQPRERVLCLAEDDAARLRQLAAVLAVGSQALWPARHQALLAQLPAAVRSRIALAADWTAPGSPAFDAVLHQGSAESLRELTRRLAARPGPLLGVQGLAPDFPGRVDHADHADSADIADIALERLMVERTLSINTAAAGGNASLMTLD